MRNRSKILIVDDNATNLAVCQEVLDTDYECACASSGEEALQLARVFLPDVILLDVMMPGIDGYETCKRLRSDPHLRFAKIILVTAKARPAERLRGYDVGADDYVTKPFDPDELAAKVRVFMRLKSVEELDKLKSDVLDLLSHETRTPLTKIVSSLEILQATVNDLDSTEWIDVAMKSCDRLKSLVTKATLLCQLRAERTRIRARTFPFRKLQEDALALVEASLPQSDVSITVNAPDDLQVFGDPELLLIVFQSILHNAVRHSPDKGVVGLYARCDDDTYIFMVTDRGAGIDPNHLPSLFTELAATNIENHSRGHGLSLAVCRVIIERHGGVIDAQSAPGQGTRFIIRLPMPVSEDEINRMRARVAKPSSKTPAIETS